MTVTAKYSTLAAWSLAICRALETHGFDPDPILNSSGLSREELQSDPDGRVDIRLMTRFWNEVRACTDDEAFGLKVADHVLPMHFRALGLLMHTAASFETVLFKLERYGALVSNSATIRIESRPAELGYCIDPIPGVAISPMAVDSFFATMIRLAGQLGGRPSPATHLELIRPQPEHPTEWTRYFGVPVCFGASQNALWFARDKLQHNLVAGDQRLAAYNEAMVRDYVDSLESASTASRVKQLILSDLESGEPLISRIADQLNLTERSLRRHLREEGVSFRKLLKQSRMELADYYLTHTNLSVTDIALRVGFSDTSNFTRAFSRWFSLSPSAFRYSR